MMSIRNLVSLRNLTLFTGALMLSASAAAAMDMGNFNKHTPPADTRLSQAAYTPDTEEVIVTAPNIRMERNPVFGLPGKASLSRRVAYSDLDLTVPKDARELRARVRASAREICDTLRDAHPVREASGTSCYRDALNDAMPRVDSAIREARFTARHR